MRQRFSNFASTRLSEDGVYLPLVAIALVAIITVIGLTQDASKLYVEQLRIQRAADAGTVAGGLLLLRNPQPSAGQIENVAKAVADDNLALNGIMNNTPDNQHDATPTVVPPLSPTSVQVETHGESDTLIMGRWVNGRNRHPLSGVSKAVRTKVAVSLILDVTGSMGDKSVLPCGGVGQPDCESKSESLKRAAAEFVRRLDGHIDRLSIVWFSTALDDPTTPGIDDDAILRTTSRFANPLDVEGSIAADIETVTHSGTTSIAAGINMAIKDFQNNATLLADYKKVAVLITDGSPNVEPPTALTGACATISNLKQRAQVAGIRAADALREYATVYAIGIGPPDPNTATAFQSSGGGPGGVEDSYLKTFFMNRVANDSAVSASDKKYSAGGTEGAPVGCIDSYSDISTKAAGESLGTPDGTQLGLLLNRIAQKILLKLDI